jgi:hypothetical protein
VIALTSLSPAPQHRERQARCVATWLAAGLAPVSLNHPSEQAAVRDYAGVTVATCELTAEASYGRPLPRFNGMLAWAAARGETVLLLNGDLELAMTVAELEQLDAAAGSGLAYLRQLDYAGARNMTTTINAGIPAFLMRPEHAALCAAPSDLMAFGQPWWDFWLPYAAVQAGLGLVAPATVAAYHQIHTDRWSWPHWERGAAEFARLTGIACGAGAEMDMSTRVYQAIVAHTTFVGPPAMVAPAAGAAGVMGAVL